MNKQKWEELKAENRKPKAIVYVKEYKASPPKSHGYKLRGVGITRKDKTSDKKLLKKAQRLLNTRKKLNKVV